MRSVAYHNDTLKKMVCKSDAATSLACNISLPNITSLEAFRSVATSIPTPHNASRTIARRLLTSHIG